jgi:hypothetical protein
VVLAVVAAVLLVSYASSVRAWLAQRGEIALLQDQISERRAAVVSLRAEMRRWRDPAYVEAQARERFGWVMPGEKGYRVLGLDGRPLGVPLVAGDATADAGASEDWWNTVWGSVEAAGREPKSAAETRADTPATRITRGGAVQHATPKQRTQQPAGGSRLAPDDGSPQHATPGQLPGHPL